MEEATVAKLLDNSLVLEFSKCLDCCLIITGTPFSLSEAALVGLSTSLLRKGTHHTMWLVLLSKQVLDILLLDSASPALEQFWRLVDDGACHTWPCLVA